MGIPAIVTMQNRNTNRNPVAKSLKNKEYKQTIINSKKIYSRKGEKNEIIKELQSLVPDPFQILRRQMLSSRFLLYLVLSLNRLGVKCFKILAMGFLVL